MEWQDLALESTEEIYFHRTELQSWWLSSGSEEGIYGKPALLLCAAMCRWPLDLFPILQVQVKNPDWELHILSTSKQNTKHRNLSLRL